MLTEWPRPVGARVVVSLRLADVTRLQPGARSAWPQTLRFVYRKCRTLRAYGICCCKIVMFLYSVVGLKTRYEILQIYFTPQNFSERQK